MNRFLMHFLMTILGAFVLNSQNIKAQEVELDYFEANQNQEQVLLKWAISKGSVCNGITITRSSDSLYFETIGRIEGVCGSPDFQQPYSFVDEAPLKNKINYYKLELGISDFSEVISIKTIDKNGKAYQVIPNPIQEQGRIYFDNPYYENHQIDIYNINGSLVNTMIGHQNYFGIEAHLYSTGLYIFHITTPEKTIKGKFIISP